MEIWHTVILIVHVLAAAAIIGLVLLQHGKGADVGAAFGGGASGSLFGATGSANFLSRATAFLALVFFLTSLGLAYLATHKPRTDAGVMESTKEAPAVPVPQSPAPQSDIPVPAEAAGKAGGSGRSKANQVPK
ncbi:MAG: preprotein translocase subunit SecG [Betaproteobacteria bacterium]|nr:preprotein translocase subunit SecG [Betaproteobacteria bacterium]